MFKEGREVVYNGKNMRSKVIQRFRNQVGIMPKKQEEHFIMFFLFFFRS